MTIQQHATRRMRPRTVFLCDYTGPRTGRCRKTPTREVYPRRKDAGWSYVCSAHFAQAKRKDPHIVYCEARRD